MAATTANTPETMIPEGGVANFAVLEFAIFFLMKGCWWAGVLVGWSVARVEPCWRDVNLCRYPLLQEEQRECASGVRL